MMLFHVEQCRWCSVAWQEFEQRPESLLGSTWRDAALFVHVQPPLEKKR